MQKQTFDVAAYANDIVDLRLDLDPLAWVLYAFPWGEPGTELENESLEDWQIEELSYIRDKLQEGYMLHDVIQEVIRTAVTSGHGVGKSALVAWLVLWALSTFVDTKGIVTANTASQLAIKTWPEIVKWHKLCICEALFTTTATAIFSTDPLHEKNWRVDATPWSEHNHEAFAGLHNAGKRIIIIFDEASKIPAKIWEVTAGAQSDKDTEIIWAVFGNPTRNVGDFRECFRNNRKRWYTIQVDARKVRRTNKVEIQNEIEDYGLDSDRVKVRWLGEFPNASDKQFIPGNVVDEARRRHLNPDEHLDLPVIITCDPAWWGGDETVIAMRQGRKFEILKVLQKNDDDVFVAGLLAGYETQHRADAVIIDQGYGTGIYSIGKAMNRVWILIAFGGKSRRADCVTARDAMWHDMKDWLTTEQPDIPDDLVLAQDLTGPEYDMTLSGQIKLESKEDMKDKGIPSPNRADALALSFAVAVAKKGAYENQQQIQAKTEYTMRTFKTADSSTDVRNAFLRRR